MTETKRSSDFSNRLKRPLRNSSRTAKSSASSSTISAPPKATIATSKSKKDEIHRRKNHLDEMRHPKPEEKATVSRPSTSDGHGKNERKSVEHEVSAEPTTNYQLTHNSDRIAELEIALAIAREEQERLRQELQKVRAQGRISGDISEDRSRQYLTTYGSPRGGSPGLQRDDNRLSPNRKFSPRRSNSSTRHEELVEQNYFLRNQVSELQDQVMQQDSQFRTSQGHSFSQDSAEWEELTTRLHHTEKESQERLQQLLNLKHSISALTHVENQIADTDLSEQIDQLYHRIREFVVSNYRRTKLSFSSADAELKQLLHSINPQYEKIQSSDKLSFYQALVSNAIMYIFREPIYLGLPETGPLSTIRQLAGYIYNQGSEYHEWRRMTIRALEKSDKETVFREERQKVLHRIANDIQHQLFTLTSTNLNSQAQTTLLGILTTAADLQHMLLQQKARYAMQFFRNQDGNTVAFDRRKMESVNDLDEMDDDGDVFLDRQFFFCVFPCLEKFGDEFGERTDIGNILLKAKVCSAV